MAVTFTLTSTGLTTIDLTDTSSSIFLQEFDYVPMVATPTGDGSIPPYVTETLPVGIHATSYDQYALLMQYLAALQLRAAEYWAGQQSVTPVWLTCKMDGETTGRQALVKAIHFEFRPWAEALYQECGTSVPPGHVFGTMLIERHPYWEALTADSEESISGISTMAGAYDYTGAPATDVVGDVPARINKLRLTFSPNTPAKYTWIGFRSAIKHPALANFVPNWQAELGSMQQADTTVVATVVNCTFASGAGWLDRIWLELDDVPGTNYDDNYGEFLILMRAKVDGATTVEVKLEHKYLAQPGGGVQGRVVEITNTDWALYEMGTVRIPLRDLHAIPTSLLADVPDRKQGFLVHARRTGGAGDIDWDRFIMVPIDELFLYLEEAWTDGSTPRRILISSSPEDTYTAITYDDLATDQMASISPLSVQGAGVPLGDGRLYIVMAEADKECDTGDTVAFQSSVIPRWLALRGAE